MLRATLFLAGGVLAILACRPTQAQNLTLPETSSMPISEAPAAPPSGMPMEEVERRFGPPLQRSVPVGQPPILVWRYSGFRVYFEHDRVIHSVLDKTIENSGLVDASP